MQWSIESRFATSGLKIHSTLKIVKSDYLVLIAVTAICSGNPLKQHKQ
jgi:hypothetical protein